MRVLPVERLGLSLDPARGLDPDEPPLEADESPPEDEEPPPRVTALPPPPPEPDDRGVAPCPSSEYDMPLLKPARRCGADSRADPAELDDGDETAFAEGELKDEPPLPLLVEPPPPLELATLPPPSPLEPLLPRSTAPPLLAAPPPFDRSGPVPALPSVGLLWPNAGAVASAKPATTIPSLKLKPFMCAPLWSPRKTWLYAP